MCVCWFGKSVRHFFLPLNFPWRHIVTGVHKYCSKQKGKGTLSLPGNPVTAESISHHSPVGDNQSDTWDPKYCFDAYCAEPNDNHYSSTDYSVHVSRHIDLEQSRRLRRFLPIETWGKHRAPDRMIVAAFARDFLESRSGGLSGGAAWTLAALFLWNVVFIVNKTYGDIKSWLCQNSSVINTNVSWWCLSATFVCLFLQIFMQHNGITRFL